MSQRICTASADTQMAVNVKYFSSFSVSLIILCSVLLKDCVNVFKIDEKSLLNSRSLIQLTIVDSPEATKTVCRALVRLFTAPCVWRVWEASQLQTVLCYSWRLQKKLQWVTYLGRRSMQRWCMEDRALLQPICAQSRLRREEVDPVLLIYRGDGKSVWQHAVGDR